VKCSWEYVVSSAAVFWGERCVTSHKTVAKETGNMQTSQEHFTTIVFAKFGGQIQWIMGNWKIENCLVLWKRRNLETRVNFRIVFKMFEKSNQKNFSQREKT